MGELFEWDAAKYSLEIPRIDDEHRQIIDAMNQLHRLHVDQQPRHKQGDALHRLVKVTAAHFKDEEMYMEQIGYADLRKHRHIHQQLLDRLDGFAKEFQASGVLTEELFMFLKMWLKSHICGIDTQYARHVHAA